ncbi:MAG: helix-turn-helix domain-containing protein [Rikenellaceae bacterium]
MRGVSQTEGECLHITSKEELQSDYITSIYRASSGGVWIGNAEGVALFDGERMHPITLKDKEGNAAKVRVNRVVGDSLNSVILATDIGLYTLDKNHNSFTLSYSCDMATLCALRVGDYTLIGRSDGLVILNTKSGKETPLLQGERVLNALRHTNGTIYLLTTSALYSITTSGDIETLHSAQSDSFSDMALGEQRIYISKDSKEPHSLLCYDIATSQIEQLPNIESTIIRSLHYNEDRSKLFCATDGDGVIVYNTQQQRIEHRINTVTQKITSNSIKSVLLDKQGILWLGSYSNGVYFLQPTRNLISQTEGISGYGARSMAIVSNSRYIIGSRDGLLHWIDGDVDHFKSAEYPIIKSDIILTIYPYAGDLYLVGTFGGGVFLFDEKQGKPIPFNIDAELNRALDNESVYGIEFIDNALYLFTLNGLYRYSEGMGVSQWTHLNSALPSSQLYAYGYDPSRGIFYVGSSEGVAIFDISKEEVRSMQLSGVPNDFRSNTISVGSRGDIYIDRDYTELLKIDPNTFEVEIIDFTFSQKSRISGVLEQHDSDGLWIATTKGLYSYNTKSKEVMNFAQKSGLSSTSICPNAIVEYEDRIFLGSEDGLFSLSTQLAPRSVNATKIAISQLKIDGDERAVEPMITPKSDSTQITPPIYSFEVYRGENIEVELIEPLFSRAFGGMYAISIGGDQWYYSSSNTFKLSSADMSIGRHKIYIKIADDHRHEWSEPIYIGELRVKLSRGVITLIGIVVLLPLLYLLFGVVKRNRQRAKQENTTAVKRDVDSEHSQQIIALLRSNLESSGDYKNPKYKLQDLSGATGISAKDISYLLNNYLEISFSDFINEYRIEDVKKLLLEKDATSYILPTLGERCGFNSKTSFYRIFKQKTGLTPLQYRKQQIEESDDDSQ